MENKSVLNNLPQALAASLDVEELERRLALSEMEMVEFTEAEGMEYAAANGWEVSGSGSTTGGGTATVTAKRSW